MRMQNQAKLVAAKLVAAKLVAAKLVAAKLVAGAHQGPMAKHISKCQHSSVTGMPAAPLRTPAI